ncbi:hypothetical protein [Aestuariispira insulae]|uniref:Uncharacterized protein n=1 Tax=Aestuariispira insulae TaxID=1461337 RepID=A0A3D9HQ71_9PROT|nr:hypothetical protein [Aestuariispira insulae]RED51545.1 hypothetical protein DFP90_103348 [Aestuariispira insulae]
MAKIPAEYVADIEGNSRLGTRVAQWLRVYGGSIKGDARKFGVAPATARSWRDGNQPQVRHLDLMIEAWGQPFVEYIFGELMTQDQLSLEKRIERMEAEVVAMKLWAQEFEEDNRDAIKASEKRQPGSRGMQMVARGMTMAVAVFVLQATFHVAGDNDWRTAPHGPAVVKVKRREFTLGAA